MDSPQGYVLFSSPGNTTGGGGSNSSGVGHGSNNPTSGGSSNNPPGGRITVDSLLNPSQPTTVPQPEPTTPFTTDVPPASQCRIFKGQDRAIPNIPMNNTLYPGLAANIEKLIALDPSKS